MLLTSLIEQTCAAALQETLGESAPLVRPAKDPAHGDFQMNGVMPVAKRRGVPPRDLAGQVADRLRAEAMFCQVDVAGPGFINLRLDPAFVSQGVKEALSDLQRAGVPQVKESRGIVVDFSSPNIAKQMHVGHLRSTIIGDAICRLLRFVGHQVSADNHIGDWGTQFGLLIVGMREFGDPTELERQPIEELERVYKQASERAKQDEAFAAEARKELAKLQQGDPDNRAQWEHFVSITRQSLEEIYERMDIQFDLWLGESAYQDQLQGVVDLLLERGIAREDQGAICVFFDDDPELNKLQTPFIVRKQDGAFLYSTTDLATVLYRRDVLKADAAVIVVDQRQALHFKQVFAVMRKLGVDMSLTHVGFGTVLGRDGKPLKTRDGGTIKLADLLDEAEQRAKARMQEMHEEGVDLSEEDVERLAPVVGIGAVKYADLCQNRTSDYRFDWDKLISFKGNAGPYLQYAHARTCALFRRAELTLEQASQYPIELHEEDELALAKLLLRFGDAVHGAAHSYQPHFVCDHLYALSRQFSMFYEACPVLKAEEAVRKSRLALCALASRQLQLGLSLIGISAPERM